MIKLGKVIYTILSGNTTVRNYVSLNIFPIVIPENTELPCVVYERNSDFENTKDSGYGIQNDSVDITILSENYTECIDITQAIYDCLSDYKGTILGIGIVDIKCTNVSETFAENCYIQKLTFNVKSR